MRLPRIPIAVIAAAVAVLAAAMPAAAERSSSGLRPFQAGWLDVDGNHSCAVRSDGGVVCWGDAMAGRLGYGNGSNVGDDETPATAGTVDLGGHDATQIATGSGHTCAILDTGAVACWGDGTDGALGYGNTDVIGDDETPAAAGTVNLGGHTAVAITAGTAVTCVVIETGDVKCWGRNDHGQLGRGNTLNIGDDETPATIGTVNLGGHHAVAVSAGQSHVCAVVEGGSVYCWGAGGNGRLGYGNANDIGNDETPSSAGPVNLGGMNAVAVAAGGSHTCALGDAGEVRCWGVGADGRLGDGNTSDIGDNEAAGTAGTVNVGDEVAALSAGTQSTCATTAAGAVRCWGFNATGLHGRANTTTIGDNETPASAGAVSLGTAEARAIATGFVHTCALRDDDTVWCWGSGSNGKTGHASTTAIGDDEAPSAGNAAVALGGPVTSYVGDLSLAVAPSAPTGTVGDDVTVTLTLTNDGPDTAGTPTVDVGFTGSPTVVSAIGSGTFAFGTWAAGNLASGQTATLTLVLRPTAAGTLTVTVDLHAAGTWDPDSTPGNAASGEDDHAVASVTVAGLPPAPPSDPAPADPVPADPAPADPAPRVAPRGLTLEATRAGGGRRVTVTGRLLLPPGAADACDGSVRVTATAGRRTAGSAVATLRRAGTACTYAGRLSLPPRTRTVTVSARFLGNDDLLARTAPARTLRAA
ncbi:MAG: hypothetical protein U0237_12155 [Thermoleophilia bacterium]